MDTLRFSASVVRGAGRGKKLGAPTLNLSLDHVPPQLEHGVYACWILLPDAPRSIMGALHFGPRLVFGDSVSLEVHALDCTIEVPPETVTVEVMGRVRSVQHFSSPEDLAQAIQNDIRSIRTILSHP